MIGIKIEDIDLKLSLGSEYEVRSTRNTKRKNETAYFKGVFVQETENLYVFRCKHNYCECFSKVDFARNIYSIRIVKNIERGVANLWQEKIVKAF